MILENISVLGNDEIRAIRVCDGKISALETDATSLHTHKNELRLFFENDIVFPGLINSHDHLDFNLFPAIGNHLYSDYTAWAEDIHKKNKTEINAILKIPQQLRTQWGLYKNLLAGVTTVVHHGMPLSIPEEFIHVFQQCYALHSVRFEKYWKYRILRPFRRRGHFVIHVGEGTNKTSSLEIDELIRWNLLKRELVAIHGVAMNPVQAPSFRALVWCPASNFFLLGKTADVEQLMHFTRVIFGTDSTLTASWNIWEHLRQARLTKKVSDEELFNMLTFLPARVWNLEDRGRIAAHHQADIVIGRQKPGLKGFNAFYELNPEDLLLVIRKGNLLLFDETLLPQLARFNMPLQAFNRIAVRGRCKYIYGNLPRLISAIQEHCPHAEFPVDVPGS